MKKILEKLLSLSVVMVALIFMSNVSYADEDSDLEEYINAASYMLEENRDYFSQKTIKKLENWIQESSKLLENRRAEKVASMDLEKKIQVDIENNLKERNDFFEVFVNDYISEDRIHDIFQEALSSNRYFYYAIYKGANISTNYYQQTNENGENFVESVDFSMSYRQSKEDEKKVEDFVNKWVKDNIKDDMTELDKIKIIHDFIVKRNSYYTGEDDNLSEGYSIYSPASILFGKGGVCNVYATLFDKMSEKSGLNTYYSTGEIKENGQLHIRNMVQIEDDWYNIDLTWDDPVLTSNKKIINEEDFVSYDYFLISDEKIKKSRTIDEDEKRPPSVKSYDHNFKTSEVQFEKAVSNVSYMCQIANNERDYHVFHIEK